MAVTVAARDENLPLPSCVAVISPFADLTFSGASLELRKLADPYVTRELLESMAAEYLDGADPADPRCSSVFADLHDLPPLLIQVGEDEILFDDAARIRDAAIWPPESTPPFSRGPMASTSGPSTYPPDYPNPRSRSNTWRPS